MFRQAIIDWTGVLPDASPIEPLDDHTFAVRLRLLTERSESFARLRGAFIEQHPNGGFPQDSRTSSRQSR
jgi:hypothetical protein